MLLTIVDGKPLGILYLNAPGKKGRGCAKCLGTAGLLVIPEKNVPRFKELRVRFCGDKDKGGITAFRKDKSRQRMQYGRMECHGLIFSFSFPNKKREEPSFLIFA
ncbi:MAG: hypothetical protein IJU20_08205 [Clostridia bacterium]|nr:hypothetical protein [Clostridia bacterium]